MAATNVVTTINKSKMTMNFFAENGAIVLEKIPIYQDFKKKFNEPLDKKLLELMVDDERIHVTQRTILKKLIKQINRDGNLVVNYENKVGDGLCGRFYPKFGMSIMSLSKFIKHTMFEYLGWVDFDMVCAHPSIAVSICDMFGINLKNFKHYIANREEMNEIVALHYSVPGELPLEFEDAKDLFNILTYGGGVRTWRSKLAEPDPKNNQPPKQVAFVADCAFVTKYKEDRAAFMAFVNRSTDLKAQTWKNFGGLSEADEERKNVGSLGSAFLGTIENHILYTTYLFLKKNKVISKQFCGLEYDGLGVPKVAMQKVDIIRRLNAEILLKTGLDVKMIVKGYKPKYILQDVIDKRNEIQQEMDDSGASDVLDKTYADWEDYLSFKPLANTLIKNFGKYFARNGSRLFVYWGDFDETNEIVANGMWYEETDASVRPKINMYLSEKLYDIIHSAVYNANGLEEYERTKLLKLTRDTTDRLTAMNNIFVLALSSVKESAIPFDSKKFLLGMKNGVIDLLMPRGEQFRPYRYDDYMTLNTGYDYIPTEDTPENRDRTAKLVKIFEDIEPNKEERDFLLQTLASGLDAMAYQHLFMFNGCGGNGKGLIGLLMAIILGSDYYLQPGNGILRDAEKANAPSPDWYELMNKRYINFKEVDGKLKVAIIRNLTGGGEFSGRLLKQNPVKFYMNATWVMEFNQAQHEFDQKLLEADRRRLYHKNFTRNFTLKEEKIGTTDDKGITWIRANMSYITTEFLEEHKFVFLDMLLDIHDASRARQDDVKQTTGFEGIIFNVPESVRLRTNQFMANSDKFTSFFKMFYELSPNKEEVTTYQSIWTQIKNSDSYRIGLNYKEKAVYGRDAFYTYLSENIKNGETTRGKFIIGYTAVDENEPEPLKQMNELHGSNKRDFEEEEEEIEHTSTKRQKNN